MATRPITALFAAGLALAGCAGGGGDNLLTVRQTPLGPVLTDAEGMTLYTLQTDPKGRSECYGRCAAAWPPALAPEGLKPGGRIGMVVRKDGTRQLAYDGRPLYGWAKATKPGDVGGHDVGEVWFVARP